MTTHTPPNYHVAIKRMPRCLVAGFDPLDKTTVAGIWWYARITLDIHEEGDECDIRTKAQANAVTKYLNWLGGTTDPDQFAKNQDLLALRFAGWMGHTHIIVRTGKDASTDAMGQCTSTESAKRHMQPGDRLYVRTAKGWRRTPVKV